MQVRLISAVKLLRDSSLPTLKEWLVGLQRLLDQRSPPGSSRYWAPLGVADLVDPQAARVDLEGLLERCGIVLDRGAVRFPFHDGASDGEGWNIQVWFTRIPHVELSSLPGMSAATVASFVPELLESMLRTGWVDVAVSRVGDFRKGQIAAAYLVEKIQRVQQLADAYDGLAGHGARSMVDEFLSLATPVLSASSETGSPVIDLPRSKSSLRLFLRSCDQALLAAWGEARLEAELAPSGVSLKEWFKAGSEPSLKKWLGV